MYVNLESVTNGFEEKAKKLERGSNVWIFRANQDKGDRLLLEQLDKIVSEMTDSERGKLKTKFTKIVFNNAQKYRSEFNDQFVEVLVGLLGWGWLKKNYRGYAPSFANTPDLLVKDNSGRVRACMECKRIRTSDQDRAYFANQQGTTKRVNDDLAFFSNKIKYTLDKAEEQVNKIAACHKLIFLSLSLDIDVGLIDEQRRRVVCLLSKFATDLGQRDVVLVSFEHFEVEKPITGVFNIT
jgi:hypothetical protein